MLNILESIANFFTTIMDFVISFFQNVVELVTLVVQGSVTVIEIIGFMPIQYKAIMLALVAYYVIYTIKNLGG